jgi:hypothetical protein
MDHGKSNPDQYGSHGAWVCECLAALVPSPMLAGKKRNGRPGRLTISLLDSFCSIDGGIPNKDSECESLFSEGNRVADKDSLPLFL